MPDATADTIPLEVTGTDEFLQMPLDRIAARIGQFNGILHRHPAALTGEVKQLRISDGLTLLSRCGRRKEDRIRFPRRNT